MKRKIIKIDEDKCTGCGLCVPGCREEAIKIIDGKARLVNDIFCDGLGACMGECPEGALSIEEREAEPFDEIQVQEALHKKNDEKTETDKSQQGPQVFFSANTCPGSMPASFNRNVKTPSGASQTNVRQSELTHWPVQMHLINPGADFFRGKDVVLAADCVAFALGDFHEKFLKGRSLTIACPKLDEGQEEYVEKIRRLADEARINTLTVIIMEVPCCRGLIRIARAGLDKAARKVPLKIVTVGIQGDVLSEEWI